jgi:ribosome-associated heat shock protein Hsp15
MRLDRYLDRVCLFPTRSAAGRALKSGSVAVNGTRAKASHEVHPGEIVSVRQGMRNLEIEVVAVPTGPVSRKDAREFYRVLGDDEAPVD